MKTRAEFTMRQRQSLKLMAVRVCLAFLAIASFCVSRLAAQSCETSADLDEAIRLAITATAQRDFDMAARGDAASLRLKAAASLAADFSGIEAAIKDHQKDLAGAKATPRSVFLLGVDGSGPLAHGEFYCGVFGKNGQTATSAVFYLDNLQPGKYGVVILDAASSTAKDTFSIILELAGSDWKLGGLYIRGTTLAGHDGDWFLARAREYKSKGQAHNAWFYFLEARDIASPLNFMSTAATDKLYDEAQSAKPADLPTDGKITDLAAGTASYKLTAIFPQAEGDDLDLVVKYQAADVSNTSQAYQNNVAVMKALAAKFPELKDAFAGVVARAVDPGGHDYGTLLAMKDIK
jgi:hypothetical protein